MCSLSAMTIHKYLSILHSVHFERYHVFAMIALAWFFPCLVMLLMNVINGGDGTLSGLQVSKTWCFVAMSLPAARNMVAAALIMAFIIGNILILIFSHLAIIRAYAKWKKKTTQHLTNAPPLDIVKYQTLRKGHQKNQPSLLYDADRLRKEKLLVRKSIAISSLFASTYILFVCKALYEVILHQQVSFFFDSLVEIFAIIGPVVNVYILYVYDAKFKRNIRKLLSMALIDSLFASLLESVKDWFKKVATFFSFPATSASAPSPATYDQQQLHNQQIMYLSPMIRGNLSADAAQRRHTVQISNEAVDRAGNANYGDIDTIRLS